jgi:hypothetical protein
VWDPLKHVWFPSLSTETVAGQLWIKHFTPSTGEITGGAFFPVGRWHTGGPGDIGAVYIVKGKLGDSSAVLEFQYFPPCNALTGYSVAFRLAGAITYGQPPPASADYEPLFGGTLPGGTWVACTWVQEPHQNCPGNPPVPDKTLANDLAFGTGAIGLPIALVPVYGELASAGLGIFSIAVSMLAADPPDHHYKQTTRLAQLGTLAIAARHGFTRRQARAATRLFTALGSSGAAGAAFMDALQRYEGAAAAVDPRWLMRQWSATLKYGHTFAARCRTLARIASRERRILTRSPLAKFRVSAGVARRMLRSVRRHGLPRALVRRLRHSGFSTSTITSARRLAPAKIPAAALAVGHSLLSPAFSAQLLRLAAGLERYRAKLAQAPLG